MFIQIFQQGRGVEEKQNTYQALMTELGKFCGLGKSVHPLDSLWFACKVGPVDKRSRLILRSSLITKSMKDLAI